MFCSFPLRNQGKRDTPQPNANPANIVGIQKKGIRRNPTTAVDDIWPPPYSGYQILTWPEIITPRIPKIPPTNTQYTRRPVRVRDTGKSIPISIANGTNPISAIKKRLSPGANCRTNICFVASTGDMPPTRTSNRNIINDGVMNATTVGTSQNVILNRFSFILPQSAEAV